MAAIRTVMSIAEPEASDEKIRSPGLTSVLLEPDLGVLIGASGCASGPPDPSPLVAVAEVRCADWVGASLMGGRISSRSNGKPWMDIGPYFEVEQAGGRLVSRPPTDEPHQAIASMDAVTFSLNESGSGT
jgi:hypothetical protein